MIQAGFPSRAPGQDKTTSADAKHWSELDRDGVSAFLDGKTLLLKLNADVLKNRKAVISRLSAPVRSIAWQGQAKSEIKFWPEIDEWVFSWKSKPDSATVIEVVFDKEPVLPVDCRPAKSAGDGSIMLHAYQASTFGEKLRFEPQWYKNTVGYWAVASDYATWKLEIEQPGRFTIAVLQGCGGGQGGSDALVTLRQDEKVKAKLPFKTVDTGHFQNFRWNHLGSIEVSDAGNYELRIEAKRIAKGALFDVRNIHLVRQAK